MSSPNKLDSNANEHYDFIFVPTAFIDSISALSYDVFVNMDSFGEMPQATVEYYFDFFTE